MWASSRNGLVPVEADALEDAVAVQQPVVEDGDPRIRRIHPLPVHVGHHLELPSIVETL